MIEAIQFEVTDLQIGDLITNESGDLWILVLRITPLARASREVSYDVVYLHCDFISSISIGNTDYGDLRILKR